MRREAVCVGIQLYVCDGACAFVTFLDANSCFGIAVGVARHVTFVCTLQGFAILFSGQGSFCSQKAITSALSTNSEATQIILHNWNQMFLHITTSSFAIFSFSVSAPVYVDGRTEVFIYKLIAVEFSCLTITIMISSQPDLVKHFFWESIRTLDSYLGVIFRDSDELHVDKGNLVPVFSHLSDSGVLPFSWCHLFHI